MLSPDTYGVGDFMARLSGLTEVPRIEFLFRMYKCYCRLAGYGEGLDDHGAMRFDNFLMWGEVVASDFSEVDKYDADAESVFRNVKDVREIAASFLSEEQCDAVERYFGVRPTQADASRFWLHVGNEEERTRLKEKFLELWRLLPELYAMLREDLDSDGMGMEGTLFRRAMERVCDRECGPLPWKRIFVVGFNMLSTTEAKMFTALSKMQTEGGEPYAEFFWDATGPVLGEEGTGNVAAGIKRYRKLFSEPDWFRPYMEMCAAYELPGRIRIAGAPSNAAQAKLAAAEAAEWVKELGGKIKNPTRTAIVVPDENLLLPLVHSLDLDEINVRGKDGAEHRERVPVNLTLGYSLRYTSVASFVYHLRRLQSRQRKSGGVPGYQADDLKLFTSHPFVHALAGTAAIASLNTEVAQTHRRIVTLALIESHSPVLARTLTPLDFDTPALRAIEWLDGVLAEASRAVVAGSGEVLVNGNLELTQIETYRDALGRLANSVEAHGMDMHFQNVFYLADKLLAGEKVSFEGEPLLGLQVMGLLETRAIDFDNVAVLSMNDKIMPRRGRKRTFIPDALRASYGLPLSDKGEELYSYYFYRLISRAKNVVLFYDARAGEGMRSGGMSRFLLQLDMLYARGKTVKENYAFILDRVEPEEGKVEKSEAVMAKLAEFTQKEDGRNLSASAMGNYFTCPVKFYYKNVVGLGDDSDREDYVDDITVGNVMHQVMLALYIPEPLWKKYLKKRVVVSRELIESHMSDLEGLDRLVRRALNQHHLGKEDEALDDPLGESLSIVASHIRADVVKILGHDLTLAPFEILGGEIKGQDSWKLDDGREVNLNYAIDRVDCVNGRVRVVDYKSGKAHVDMVGLGDMFSGRYSSHHVFQLMLYAWLLKRRMAEEGDAEPDEIGLAIYSPRSVEVENVPVRGVEAKERVSADTETLWRFANGLDEVFRTIFAADAPFVTTRDDKTCSWCAYSDLCSGSGCGKEPNSETHSEVVSN